MNINEIAKLAGVSRATVSRYLNNGYVSDEKKERIQEVIDRTGYKPSTQAQTLRTKKTRLIGVILPKINSDSISRMVAGISVVLKEAGYQLLLANTENREKEELEYLRLFSENHVDGIILIATIITREHKRALKALQVPVVLLGQRLDGYSCVYQDDCLAARDVSRLLLRGAGKIGCIGVTQQDEAVGAGRRKGFLEAAGDAGIAEDAVSLLETGFSVEDGYRAMDQLLALCPGADAVFCATDSIALGALARLQEAGRQIPEEVALAGVGDTVSGRIVSPKLTSVHFYYKTSGKEAARLLLELLDGNEARKQIKMGYRVEERGTTRQR
ncbi:LacI family DNA-binding transcriptional regulator [Eisenbergiella massiliensis]|uniref:LacI family DNA-binding transcriptional regulator n=1 Tax=Eisenbergiella massiliensis TaxID=1720294 RepID=UPI003996564F